MPHVDFLQQHAACINVALEQMLQQRRNLIPEKLWNAMHYSLMAGGKRIRPALILECHAACGGRKDIMPAAMGIECMHTYSLIHDDLPSMDNDDLRRGQPTCHRQFNEATAILAADALQTLGFELLTRLDAPATLATQLVERLAIAAGGQGMVGGQILDMQAGDCDIHDVQQVEHIHLHKTGAMLRYCCEAGAILARADAASIDACSRYGKAVGLLFQITDDILDATSTEAELGKSAGKDAAQHKATYVSILGLERAREAGRDMLKLAMEAIQPLGDNAENLRALAQYILERRQ